MQLPLKLTPDLMQTRWKSILDPVIDSVNSLQEMPLNNIVILNNVALAIGNNVITHGLGKIPTGWIILDVNAATTIYRSAAFNLTTITLNSSAVATVKLGVF